MQLHRAHHSVLLNVSWTNTLFLTEHLYYTAALIKKGTTVLSIIKSKQCAEANAKRGIKWKKKKPTEIRTQTDRPLLQNTCSLDPTALQPTTPFLYLRVSPLPAHTDAIKLWLDSTKYALLQGQSDQCKNKTTLQYLLLRLIHGGIPPL